jgi:hypothetical protein
MKKKKIILIILVSVILVLIICVFMLFLTGRISKIDAKTTYEDTSKTNNSQKLGESRIGFEILEVKSFNSIRAWITLDITGEEFGELKLPLGWFKNQPRETEPDSSRFYKSPGTSIEGEFLDGEAFGYHWRHSATVIKPKMRLDPEGLLSGSIVNKYHEVTFNKGRIIYLLVSPEKDYYIRITRDANRINEKPTLPADWQLINYTLLEKTTIVLPEETLVIRTDNEDSFQGPVSEFANANKFQNE